MALRQIARATVGFLFLVAAGVAQDARAQNWDGAGLIRFGVFLQGAQRLPWHELPLSAARVQQLPCWLRAWPEDYGPARRLALHVYRHLRRVLGVRRRGAVGAMVVMRMRGRCRDGLAGLVAGWGLLIAAAARQVVETSKKINFLGKYKEGFMIKKIIM